MSCHVVFYFILFFVFYLSCFYLLYFVYRVFFIFVFYLSFFSFLSIWPKTHFFWLKIQPKLTQEEAYSSRSVAQAVTGPTVVGPAARRKAGPGLLAWPSFPLHMSAPGLFSSVVQRTHLLHLLASLFLSCMACLLASFPSLFPCDVAHTY